MVLDSTITLDWINSSSGRHKTFVANRIAEIQDVTKANQWRHVDGKQNPADCLSGGVHPEELRDHKLWWKGPTWIKLPKEQWPNNPNVRTPEDQLELKNVRNLVTINPLNEVMSHMLEKYSSFNLLARVTARIKTFSTKKKSERRLYSEIEKEKMWWIKATQKSAFHSEIEAISNGRPLVVKSKLLSLYPFLDSNGILRVGGRLKEASIDYDAKHQIIIPEKVRIAKMIINDAHKITRHGGTQLTVTYTRNRYWIINTKRTIRNQIWNCMTCDRYAERMQEQLMGSLPQARVNLSRAFLHTGVDYAGPIDVLTMRKPGRRQVTKGYVAIFVCLCTKAIHLELVSRLTTEAFVAAFTRFTSRRGLPSNMYSDNAREMQREILEPEAADVLLRDAVVVHTTPRTILGRNLGGRSEEHEASL